MTDHSDSYILTYFISSKRRGAELHTKLDWNLNVIPSALHIIERQSSGLCNVV